MIEEMLISPILTIMSIFRLPGGQLVSRGYVANFSQDIAPLCRSLPRKTSEIPLLIVKKIDQNNESKEFTVNRNRITTLLHYLCENNPDWKAKGITINEDNLSILPENDIPKDLNEVASQNIANETLDKVIIQTGPHILEENTNNDEFIDG